MIPAYYEYYNPVKILAGRQALDNIPYELETLGCRRPMVITDKGITEAGLIKTVLDAWAGSGLVVGALYDETPPDSSNAVVNRVAEIYRGNNCDSIVAVGGGSVMDTAKAVNIVITEESDDLMKFVGAERLRKRMRPLIAVPTTSGTGSEVTMVAVIANPEKKCKMAFTSYMLFPDVAVLDPRMTMTVPPRITAATGMDALAHAVEAYSGLQKNPLSDGYAFPAVDLIRQYLIRAVRNGNDEEARMAMANASLLAGCAFSNSMVGIVHSIGHALGGVCGVPHGVAMAILLPWGMEYNMKSCAGFYGRLLPALAGPEVYARTLPDQRALQSVAAVRQLHAALNRLSGLPLTLKEAGVEKDQFPQIAATAQGDGSLVFNREEAELEDIISLLEAAY